MTDKAGAKTTTDAAKDAGADVEKAAKEAAALEEAKKNSKVMQQAQNFEKKPFMAGMAKEFAQNAYTTKAGNEL